MIQRAQNKEAANKSHSYRFPLLYRGKPIPDPKPDQTKKLDDRTNHDDNK